MGLLGCSPQFSHNPQKKINLKAGDVWLKRWDCPAPKSRGLKSCSRRGAILIVARSSQAQRWARESGWEPVEEGTSGGFRAETCWKRGSSARFSLQQKYDMNLQKFAVDRPKCRLHQESVNWQRTLIHLIRKNRVWNTDVRRDVPPLAIRNPWFFLTTWMFHAFSSHFQVPNGTKPFSGFPYTLVIQHNYVEDLNHRSISMRNVHESSMAKCNKLPEARFPSSSH